MRRGATRRLTVKSGDLARRPPLRMSRDDAEATPPTSDAGERRPYGRTTGRGQVTPSTKLVGLAPKMLGPEGKGIRRNQKP